jgi:thiol-disulfide isomerase/thioredoxin
MRLIKKLTWPALIVALLLMSCGGRQPAPEFRGIDDWINSEPLTLTELRGKVVLIDFWTYTCVNCIRTFPYLKEWHDKYADYGLVIIGVHTPEFEFEKARQNVIEAARTHGLEYPIAQDNNYATWNAYFNSAWPAKYLIDYNGDVRYVHLGEGAYAETEKVIRELLEETGISLEHIDANTRPEPQVDQEAFAADPSRRVTRELYAGYERNHTLPSAAFATLFGETPAYIMHEEYYQQKDADIFYQDPGRHSNHFIYLQGQWRNGPQSLTHARTTEDYEDYIVIKFYATSINAVMSRGTACRASTCAPTEVRITLDNRPLAPAQAGEDVRFDSQGNSYIMVDQARMYRLVELPQFSSYDLKLSVNSADFSLFIFTFGAYDEGP